MIPLDGKSDEAQLQALYAYLIHSCGWPPDRVKKEPYLLFSRYDGSLVALCEERVTQEELDGCIPHHPDLVITYKRGKPRCIIELDGSIHDSKSGRRKTEKRNGHYRDAHLPCIVINIADLAFTGETWFAYLDRKLKRLRLHP